MRVRVDNAECVASGQCVVAVPQVFAKNKEDGTAVLLRPDPPAELHDAVVEAADVCPAAAIFVEDN